jgi:hypothetical protein
MKTFDKYDKYKHAILDVVRTIHGSNTGASDTLLDEELDELLSWLDWRTMEAWDEQRSERFQAVDLAVWNLARETVEEARNEKKRRARRSEREDQKET